ncbi:MAG TPA: glycosyltransferase family 2 protein [Candidatus Dormibacteraeota bacterium]|nr:glycosyltransferase family 2 protein [Candidatus Dormibacteraeota bacterium]
MFQGRQICVVVPAFNEERHIATVIRNCPALVDHLVVVDDHSTDSTSETALGVADSRVVLIRHETNQGVGGALVSGYRRALDLGADVVVVMAGDDQMDPAYLPNLLEPICSGQVEVAKGNRFYSWSSLRHMPALRMLGTVVLTWATRAASGYWKLMDAQNGYVAFAASALRQVDLSVLAQGYAVENAMLIELGRVGARLRDIPIPARYGTEVSQMRIWRDGVVILSVVTRGAVRRALAQRSR